MILTAMLLALAGPALADQDEPEGEAPESTHPASDSPEAATAARARALGEPRVKRRVQAFLISLDERARAATGRVAQGVEAVRASRCCSRWSTGPARACWPGKT